MNFLFFFLSILSRKIAFGSQLHSFCVERSGTTTSAVHAVLSGFCYVGIFGDVSDPVVPTLRRASEDVVTAYAYWDTKGRFLQSLALPMAGQGPCERHQITVPTNNAYMGVWAGTQPAYPVFRPGQLKNRCFRNLVF